MLEIVKKVRDLQFDELMSVYAEGNLENGKEQYPALSERQQILRVEEKFYQYLVDFFQISGALYCILTENSHYVSALRLEPDLDGVLLEALETRPDMRRHGYARELIQLVLQHLKEHGSPNVYSHVSKRNVPSLQTHLSCGFQRIKETALYIDGSVMNNSWTMLFHF